MIQGSKCDILKIKTLKASFERTLDYQDILMQYDAKAPNRLLFLTLAYFLHGFSFPVPMRKYHI